ncbi:hypothetical protein EDB81DRAFT_768746 [Dactylonectria macrodidyma]|uniref:Uncharacterized protein n=1 Tax=Dactylonectria macrodidyma TaxID=307937 RepID=A0A9P9I7F5_9HYPO|nr:hypothetical protein EDB81DRAFT_768746 [Dactylonectria macrodidyma]
MWPLLVRCHIYAFERATLLQLPLIDAAAIAGVKRFIPPEFGENLQNPNVRQLINYRDKTDTGIMINLKHGMVYLYDGSKRKVSMMRMPTVAQAVNRLVCIHEARLSQKQLLAYAKEVVQGQEWKEDYVDLNELERRLMSRGNRACPI